MMKRINRLLGAPIQYCVAVARNQSQRLETCFCANRSSSRRKKKFPYLSKNGPHPDQSFSRRLIHRAFQTRYLPKCGAGRSALTGQRTGFGHDLGRHARHTTPVLQPYSLKMCGSRCLIASTRLFRDIGLAMQHPKIDTQGSDSSVEE